MTYESASHNDAVSHFTELPGVLGLADAEADTDGQIGLRPQPAKLAREAAREVAHARQTLDRAVEELR